MALLIDGSCPKTWSAEMPRSENEPLNSRFTCTVGERDGDELGLVLGDADGESVGLELGLVDGSSVGDVDGEALGLVVGLELGLADGMLVGLAVGDLDGDWLGDVEGSLVGDVEGLVLGAAVSHVPITRNLSPFGMTPAWPATLLKASVASVPQTWGWDPPGWAPFIQSVTSNNLSSMMIQQSSSVACLTTAFSRSVEQIPLLQSLSSLQPL